MSASAPKPKPPRLPALMIKDGGAASRRNNDLRPPRVVAGLASTLGELSRSERKYEAEMMPKWSRLHEACLNCGTQRRPHYGKGFCKPCHVMMKRIWAAEKWDLRCPETLTSRSR